MDPSIIQTASISALKSGKTLEEIYVFGSHAKVSREAIDEGLVGIANDPLYAEESFMNQLQSFKKGGTGSVNNDLWDPFNKPPSDALLNTRNRTIQDRFEDWKAHPDKLKRNFIIFSLIGFVFYGFYLLIPGFRFLVNSWFLAGEDPFVYGYVLPWTPAVMYWLYIKKTQIDIIKRLVADKFGWKYDPSNQKSRWHLSEESFPELFRKGNQNQFIEDQFWGTYKEKSFWGGLFHFERVSGSGKNRSVKKYNQHFFTFQVPQEIKHRFLIQPQTAFKSFTNFFRKKDIETESVQFNKMFEVVYPGKKVDNEINIVQTLSPSILSRMAEASKELGAYHVLFAGDTIVFLFEGRLFKKMKTNFLLKGVRLDERDEQFLDKKLRTMMDIYTDFIPYLK